MTKLAVFFGALVLSVASFLASLFSRDQARAGYAALSVIFLAIAAANA